MSGAAYGKYFGNQVFVTFKSKRSHDPNLFAAQPFTVDVRVQYGQVISLCYRSQMSPPVSLSRMEPRQVKTSTASRSRY